MSRSCTWKTITLPPTGPPAMLATLVRKELTLALLTYRFGIGLVLCLVAVSAGTMAVVADYQSRREAFQEAERAYADQLAQTGPYARLVDELAAFRAPRALGVFAVGADRWRGNWAVGCPGPVRAFAARSPVATTITCGDSALHRGSGRLRRQGLLLPVGVDSAVLEQAAALGARPFSLVRVPVRRPGLGPWAGAGPVGGRGVPAQIGCVPPPTAARPR